MIEYETLIRIFQRTNDRLEDTGEVTYTLEELGGQIPNVGDVIISPWMTNVEQDRHNPGRRTFYEVVHRYISPEHPRDPSNEPDQKVYIRVALEVVKRSGTAEEIVFL